MTTEYFWAIVAAVWGLTIPGLPIALYVKKRFSHSIDVAIASPFISLGASYVTVCALNFVGLHFPLWTVACGLMVISIWLLFLTAKLGSPSLKVNFNAIIVVCSTAALTIYVWTTAYKGYLFVAPNTDGRYHNFYIARIMETASALPKDVLVPSPLSPMGVANDFYPLAWHSLVAVPAALFHVSSAPAAMVSALVFWAVVMPLGILRLASLLRENAQFLGPIAALLSQIMPIVPGVPMTWGAFPSVVGIALLPGALYLVIAVARETSVWSVSLALTVFCTLLLVHSPEAFSVLLIGPMVIVAVMYQNSSRKAFAYFGGIIVLVGLAMLSQWDLISRKFSGLSETTGAVAPFSDLVSAFFQMNMNTGYQQISFAFLFIGGLVFGERGKQWQWLGVIFISFFAIYLLSGAVDKPWNNFRFLSTPWYSSYERTLWVCVPIAVIFVANSFEVLLSSLRNANWKVSIFMVPLAIFIAANLVSTLTPATISVIRKGPFENEIVAQEDFKVFKQALSLQGDNGIIYSEVSQGSLYAYMYEGVRATNGNFGRGGLPSKAMVRINSNIRSICADDKAQKAFVEENIKGLLLSTRNGGWEGAVWTREEIRKLPGFRVVAEGKYSYLLTQNFERCIS